MRTSNKVSIELYVINNSKFKPTHLGNTPKRINKNEVSLKLKENILKEHMLLFTSKLLSDLLLPRSLRSKYKITVLPFTLYGCEKILKPNTIPKQNCKGSILLKTLLHDEKRM
jgi:hypothetical protein